MNENKITELYLITKKVNFYYETMEEMIFNELNIKINTKGTKLLVCSMGNISR